MKTEPQSGGRNRYFSLEGKVTKSSRLTLLATALHRLAEDLKLASLKQQIF
ncbi:MAG: hypothetical protein MR544_10220 [Parabacteroides sp.]|nr:hypothetical protein [Parabacteroides sp.]